MTLYAITSHIIAIFSGNARVLAHILQAISDFALDESLFNGNAFNFVLESGLYGRFIWLRSIER